MFEFCMRRRAGLGVCYLLFYIIFLGAPTRYCAMLKNTLIQSVSTRQDLISHLEKLPSKKAVLLITSPDCNLCKPYKAKVSEYTSEHPQYSKYFVACVADRVVLGMEDSVVRFLNVQSVPTTHLVQLQGSGNIRSIWSKIGMIDRAALEGVVAKALQE